MKKYLDYLVLGCVLTILVGLVILTSQPTQKVSGAAEKFDYVRKTFTGMTDEVPYWNTATNNNLLWIGSATTTTEFVMDVANVGSVSFNLFTKGTTTVATNEVKNVVWYYEFTQASSTTNGTWFGEDSSSSSGNVATHNGYKKIHLWDTGQTSSSTRQILVTDINAKYMRFMINAGTTTTPYLGVWLEAIYKKGL